MMPRGLRAAWVVGMILASASPAWALPTADEQAAIARRRGVVVAQSRQEVEALFSRLCPGRCELIEINPIFAEPKVVGEVTPGFDGEGAQAFDVELKRIEVLIMLDSTLPKTFSANIPRMITSKLTPLTPNVLVQPISLEFPQPQLPPQPPIPEEPPKKAEPPPEPPKAEQPPPEPPKKEEPAPEAKKEEPAPKPWWRELWEVMLPWLPYMLMAGILVALLLRVLNQLREIAQSLRERDARASGPDAEQPMPDAAALRQELKQSRAAQNEVLRTWLADDPAAVASLVRLVGPDILSDLKQDPTLKAPLAEVSRRVAQAADPLTAQAAQRTAREARARLAAAQLTLEEQALGGSWEFMHGLSVPAVQRVLAPLSGRDKGFVVGQLPPALRAAYMGQLNADERRALFLNAGAGAPVSRDEAIALATKLRQDAEDTAHIGAEAGSQAAIVLDMMAALTPEEQEDTLRELSSKRPEVARAVLGQVCLEGAVAHAPAALVADAMIRTPIGTLVALMRGTRPDVSDALLRAAPGSQRAALASELGLEAPVSRSEYLDARAAFLQTLSGALRRDGQDLAQLNVRALQGASQPTQERGGA